MGYRIAQNASYSGSNRWKWSAWIEASTDELDDLDVVTWILHPTFTPSRIESRSRGNNFRLDTSGWGTFLLRANLQRKGQTDAQVISAMLKLTYPVGLKPSDMSEGLSVESAGPATGPESHAPTVYLSYSSEDKSWALRFRRKVEQLGARVLDSSSISPGAPFEASVRKMIRESDALMSIVGSDYVSPWVLEEMKMASADEKPMLTMLPKDASWPSGLPSNVESLRFEKGADPVESNLAAFVAKLGS